jgi:DNA-binding LacI/PurR family transcriptional regulator
VLLAIEELDYAPHEGARRLSTGRSMTVGVVVPFFSNPSYVERLRGIDVGLADTGYDLVLYNAETPEQRDGFYRSLTRRERVDGLLILTHHISDELVTRFAQLNIPVVLIDSRHPELPCVVIDDVLGGYLATRHLIELGHRRIGMISDFLESPLDFSPVKDRFVGYVQALEEADIPFRPEYHRQGKHGQEPAEQMARELLALPHPPTAVFAYSDTQAIGVVLAAREMGLQIPLDLSVIGFDDIEAAKYLRLTTIRQPLCESGLEGSRLLLAALDASEAAEPVVRELPISLVVRDTTAPL